MIKRVNTLIFWVNLLTIAHISFPVSVSAGPPRSCLPSNPNNCCALQAASCSDIGLTSFSGGDGDASCKNSWDVGRGTVCCVGPKHNSEGRCAADMPPVAPPTPPDTVVTPVEEKKLPNFASLIKTEPEEFIGNIVKGLLGLTGTVTVIMMVYGGLLWMTASGNEKAVGQAKQIILWTAIGLVLVFFSYTILSFLFNSLAG